MKNNAFVAGWAFAFACSMSPAVYAQGPAAAGVSQIAAFEGGRALHVMVAQSEIKSDINLSNISAATGGGLLGGLIQAAVDSARAKKAEELITATRAATADLDADTLAFNAAKASFASAQWYAASPQAAFSKDSSVSGKSAILDKTAGAQVAFIEYSYDLAPNFDALRVVAKIEFAKKAIPADAKGKGEKRLSSKNLLYSAKVTSVVQVQGAVTDKEANAPMWASDGGSLTRRALQKGFENLVPLTQRTLALTADSIKSLNDKKNKKIVAGGFTGRPQPTSDNKTLIWDGGFIEVSLISK